MENFSDENIMSQLTNHLDAFSRNIAELKSIFTATNNWKKKHLIL